MSNSFVEYFLRDSFHAYAVLNAYVFHVPYVLLINDENNFRFHETDSGLRKFRNTLKIIRMCVHFDHRRLMTQVFKPGRIFIF